ncbi:hypothetical protein [Ruminococcus sp. 5_1_39BFAA]|uniref:hypothetical protein n=1 Tax=Ruminococcus sp. 5_1_39BFAA TaxID=457412 RepID=UPI0035635BF2
MIGMANAKIDALQAACIEMIDYMEKANETFNRIIARELDVKLRWEQFCQSRGQEKEILKKPEDRIVDTRKTNRKQR